jgi:multidrug resistance protein MdtO
MGLFALVYAFPNVDGLGGFWLVFASGTAVAAWINFGSPRISYAGYQTGLAFYKATLQEFGPALSATVVRDRLIGVAFGLIVFGIVEHLLWPVRAAERMHARLADVLRSLAAFARVASTPSSDAGARRQLIAQQVADVQGFIESSKFEAGARGADAPAVERLTAETQTVFLVLLAIARAAASAARPADAVQAATTRVDEDVATILEGLADSVRDGGAARPIDVDGSLAGLERAIAAQIDAARGDTGSAGTIALYRELGVAVNRVVSAYTGSRTAIELADVAA